MNKKKFFEGLNRHLIIEGRKNNVVKKYPYMVMDHGKYRYETNNYNNLLEFFMERDPSGNHKYLQWMADIYNIGFLRSYYEVLKRSPFGERFGASALSVEALEEKFLKRALEEDPSLQTWIPSLGETANFHEVVQTTVFGPGKAVIVNSALQGDQLIFAQWPLFEYYDTWSHTLDFRWNGRAIKAQSAYIIRDLAHNHHKYMPYLEGSQRDISGFKNLDDLYNVLLGAKQKQAAKQAEKDKKKAAKSGARIIFEKDKVSVIRPETTEASCLFGKGTQWCISAERSNNYFDSYSKKGKSFYFFFFPGHSQGRKADKIALVLDPDGRVDSVYDSQDTPISLDSLEFAWDGYSASDLPDFAEVVELIVADTLNNPVADSVGIDKAVARGILFDWEPGILHEFDITNQRDPLDQTDYIDVETALVIEVPLNLKLKRKLETWEKMHASRSGDELDDLLAMINNTYEQNPKEYKFKEYIQKNVVKIVTAWLKENWPTGVSIDSLEHEETLPNGLTRFPKYVVEDASVTGDSDSFEREIRVYLVPSYSSEPHTETLEFTTPAMWKTYLKSIQELEQLIQEETKTGSLTLEINELLADAGIAEPAPKAKEETGQLDLPINHYPLDSIEVDTPYTLQEYFKKWLK